MERIKQFYATFEKAEKRNLRKLLESQNTGKENKSLDLIKLIEKKPEITQDEASKKLYGDPKSKAFIMMKSRLLDKMHDALRLSINEKNLRESEVFNRDFYLAKLEYSKMLQAYFFYKLKGLTNLANEQLLELRKFATENHLIFEELQTNFRMFKDSSISNPKNHSELRDGLLDIKNELDWYLDVIVLQGDLMQLANSLNKSDFLEMTEKYFLAKLDGLEAVGFPPTKMAYLEILSNYHREKGDLDKRKEVILKAREIGKTHEGKFVYNDLLNFTFHLGLIEVDLGSYDLAYGYFKECFEKYKKNSQAKEATRIYLGMLEIRFGNFEAFESLFNSFLKNVNQNTFKVYRGIFKYLECAILFVRREHKKVLRKIYDIEELSFDKSGWETNLRIFEIINLIELDEFDLASSRIEALRKHYSKYPGTEREKLIFKALSKLEKKSFIIDSLETEKLGLFSSNKKSRVISPEIIFIEKWLEAKIGKEEWDNIYKV